MSAFRVWAPHAKRVELVLRDRRVTMTAGAEGWWQTDDASARPGTDYRFSLDGGRPLPDPRSPWQPQGVHGPSRGVDHAAFRWADGYFQAVPLAAAVIYELHVGTFSPEGTFDGLAARLDHLVQLGVTHVELMPLCEFSGPRGWGYDGVDLFAPHSAYGGPDGMKRLVHACHDRGLGVILDVVYNHSGPEGCCLGEFGPYFTDRYRILWGQAMNFDGPGSDEVRRFVLDNALMWLRDYHVDGLRIDSVHAMLDSSAIHILAEMARKVRTLQAITGRRHFLIGESALNDPRVVLPVEVGGYGLDAQWSDDFHHALHAVLTGERSGYYADYGTLADLAAAFRDVFVYAGRYSRSRQRQYGRPAGDLPGDRFLAYLQTHDQVGNRAQGERIAHLAGIAGAKAGAALVMASPFVPMIFQGEEWAASSPFQYFTALQDPRLGKAVSEGRRDEFAAFGWKPQDVPDPQDLATFRRSKLDWNELTKEPHASMLRWHQQLIRLRRSRPDLACGDPRTLHASFDEQARWFVLYRGETTLACNLAGDPQMVPVEPDRAMGIVLASEPQVRVEGHGVALPGRSAAFLG